MGGVGFTYAAVMAEKPVYITTPIYYVNDRPHIGHCYTTTFADVLARFWRLAGRETYFLTGTDEHADKVVSKALENGMTPRQWADRCSEQFKVAFDLIDIRSDVFYRTSDARHKELAQRYIAELQQKGDIYLGDYVGWYDTSQDEYLTEAVAKENNYLSPVTKRPLEKRTEKNYFFRLSAYQDALQKHIDANPGFILPEARRNEVLGRLKQGLQDVPVSRAIKAGEKGWEDWGVLMPGDPGHRVYVWIEALCNYLTAVDDGERGRFWPAGFHLMAKDILWFHAVIWPAMLMAMGRALPGHVYAHSYFIRDGKKMSKSEGNFIDLDTISAYVQRYGSDAFRYYLATQGPLSTNDADFTHAKFVEGYNADLANGIGNATSRVGNMIDKYFASKVPDPKGVLSLEGHDWAAITSAAAEGALSAIARGDIAGALNEGIGLVRKVDGFINITEPFKLAKRLETEAGAKDRLAAILYQCAEALRVATVLLSPAIPKASAQLLATWNCAAIGPGVGLREVADMRGAYALKPGQGLTKGAALFMRADPAEAAPVAGGAASA